MTDIKITRYRAGQEKQISQFIKKVYDEFVADDYSNEGNRHFYKWILAENIAERQQRQRSIVLAMNGGLIVGMIESRDNNHISLLFVDKDYQKQGIAGKLFREVMKNCLKQNPDLDTFYVHASHYSIPVYEKLGFKATDGMQEQFGIKYLPMEMKIKNKSE